MAKLRLTLLGGFEARTDSGFAVAIPRKKAQMLLAYLAMHPKQTHLRDKLATLLWNDAPTEQARLSLRQALFAIRQSLPFDPTLLDGDAVAFAAEAVTVDVTEFEQLARNDEPEALERSANLYQGDLLEGIGPGSAQFEEWLRTERERLHELALEVFAKLLGHRMKLSAIEPAIHTALRLLSLDPLQEVTHRALMRLYARQGRRAAALRQYQLCVDVLQRELGLEPEEATKQVYRELLPEPPPRIAAHQAAESHRPPQRHRRRPRVHHHSRRIIIPLIGRDAEVGRLSQALARACRGHGHIVVVAGEAGIGKTRLITALREATTRRGAHTLIGRSYETERLLPFGPWVQAIREAGIVETRAVERLSAGWLGELSYLFPELRPREWPLPPEPIEALRLFDALTELVKSLASIQPVALVLEDLHWADEMSVRLFSFLGRRLEEHRILLVGSVREEELDASSPVSRMLAELAQEQRLVRLTLAPLSQEHTRVLVHRLAEGTSADESSLTRLGDRIWTLSEGNPFVIVESVREALDVAQGLSHPDLPALPEKVRELILGRFERLSETGKHLLATAAVIGRDFEFRLLQCAAEIGEPEAASAVEALVRARILHSVGERFDFTHDRLREVAYGWLLPPRRRILHARVVAALEQICAVTDANETAPPDRLGEHIERLAYHALAAELWAKAVVYNRQAGAKAAWRSAHRQAVRYFEAALDALRHLPETRGAREKTLDILFQLRWSLVPLGEYAKLAESLRRARALTEELDDPLRLGEISQSMTNYLRLVGDCEGALDAGRRARALGATLGNHTLGIRATYQTALVYRQLGDHDRAIAEFQAVVDALSGALLYERFGEPSVLSVHARTWLATVLAEVGRFTEARAHGEKAVEIAELAGNAYSRANSHLGLGVVHAMRGDAAQAIPLLQRSVALCREGTYRLQLPPAASALGAALTLAKRVDEAVPLLEQAVKAAVEMGLFGGLSRYLVRLGRGELTAGDIQEVNAIASRALETARTYRERGHEAWALHLSGDASMAAGVADCARAESDYTAALVLAEDRGMRPLVAHCHAGLAKLYERTGQFQQRNAHLSSATRMYREMDMTLWLETAEAAASHLAPSQGIARVAPGQYKPAR
jgi:DNA-binding SARP family transcriptional activator